LAVQASLEGTDRTHSRETVTRTGLVGWSRPGLRSSQAHRMKAIGYVTLERRLERPNYLYHISHEEITCDLKCYYAAPPS
ncbi:MAG: hypothetical protein ACXWPS_18640, partial [Ktedonobacteraceae bacterium]